MSLWDNVGSFFGGVRDKASMAFSSAQVTGLIPGLGEAEGGLSAIAGNKFLSGSPATQFTTYNPDGTIKSQTAPGKDSAGLIGNTLSALSYAPNQALHGLSAAYNVGDVANAHGESQLHPLMSLQDWKNAWNATKDVGFGASVYHSAKQTHVGPSGGIFGNSAANIADRQQYAAEQNTWTGKIASGAIDMAASWKFDPLILGGKAAARTRVALKTGGQSAEDASRVSEAATAINAGETPLVHNPFSTGMERAGSMLFKFAKSTDNGANLAGRQQLLTRTPETAPVLGLFDQADKISDLDKQRQVKMDIISAGQGSPDAMARLVQNAPELARATMRSSLAPEGRQALDTLHAALAGADHANPATLAQVGQAFVDSASQFGTAENAAEIAALHAKAMKSIHDSFDRLAEIGQNTPLEQSGLTALDRAKAAVRNHVADSFYYQDGAASNTVHILNWATSQRFRGTIATDHTIRGNQELMDWMTRAKIQVEVDGKSKTIPLFDAAWRQGASTTFLTAKTQERRRRQVDALWDVMYAKIGKAHGLDADTVKSIANQGKSVRQGGVRYATKQLEQARLAGDDVVTLDDPMAGTPTRIKAALLETHITNNVSLPDPTEIQRAVRMAKHAPTLGDAVAQRAAQFNNLADHFNNLWRLAVLGRPGLLVRTQIDSQGRSLAVMHGTAFVHSALGGIKNWTMKDLSKQGWTQDDLVNVDATAADHALAQQLREEADHLNATAGRNERIGAQRRGAQPTTVKAPTLEDRAAILRGHEKNTDLPLSADSLAQMSPAAMRARAELNLAKAADLESRTYETSRYRQGTQDEVLKLGKGRTMKTRAVTSGQDLRDLPSAQRKGGSPSEALTQTPPQSMTEVLNRAISREQKRLYEDSTKWVTHNPTDPHWSAGWIRAMDQMRNSYTGHKILELADTSTKDLVADLRSDPRVRQEWAEIRSDNTDFDGWIARLVNTVAWNAPTRTVREALLTKGHMNPDAVDKLFAKVGDAESTLPQRMHVQGPEFSFKPPEGAKPIGAVRKMIASLSDVPDSVAARHPVYVDRYRHHVTGLAKRELDNSGERELSAATQAKIEKIAKHRAIQDTQQIFYDTAKHTGAHNSLRYVSPFMGAWQDAIESWSRLFYDDPAVAGAFNKIWNAPNRMGLVVDQNGDAVAPGQQADQTFLVLPMEFNNSFRNAKRMTIRKDSLNSIFQGAQWYTPGVGPLVQIPAQEIVAKVYPELGDSNNPIVRTILPFGTPKTAAGGGFLSNLAADVANSTAPSYAKALYSMVNPNDPNNSQAYLASVNQQIIDARKAGKPIPNAATLDKNAAAAARSAGFVRAISIWGLGVSGQSSTVADFYKKQYDLLNSQSAALHARGTTPSAEFVKQFPEAAGLQWSLSKSQTGVNANLQAFDDEKKYSKQIKANPTFGWFYVGASNLSPDNFSQSVYNAQSSRTLGLPGSGVERQRNTRSQVIDASLAEDGWTKYNQINLAISAASNAPDANPDAIANAKRVAVAQLRQENPSWAKDFDNQDSGKLQRFIETVATPALSDPKLKNRSDIVAMGQYLSARQQVLDFLKTKGLTSLKSQAAAPLAAALDAVGQQLADQNLGFQQMWTRMFSSEVGDVKSQAAA